ncbi:MAG: hypothetical protein HN758_13025 [Verrucomicrobia bacterium]|jgi:hypothetical protein|nr:hypothetical protein [Verrucomicrobiota bacterium]MBT4274638.1 hypothetical protein [Verrucomicrobiota bacterium]MBT5062806.1 hypothetical protein [Verrucomicrobiota bacterium]MBT5479432.1 hypothetical protein [Verrucomicrobiota bacterium]MBT6804678.1 hypothetical protein [Verrucomicrobiota bacterium]
MIRIFSSLLLAALTSSAVLTLKAEPESDLWGRSLVQIESTRHQYEFFQPWSRRTSSNSKFGVVVGGQRILTTADYLFDHTVLRVQKGGRGAWYEASLKWIDYHANLALVEVEDTGFWTGLKPVKFADPVPVTGEAKLIRWNDGRLEMRRLEINRLRMGRSALSYVDLPQLELDSEIDGVGWSEAVVYQGSLIGLTTSQARSKCTAVPSFFIEKVLEEVEQQRFLGVGYFNFYWKKAENPAVLDYLKLEGEKRGVIVTEIISIPGHETSVKPKDILLKVDGFDIDITGDYLDPVYGNMMLERLATRGHWAGDKIPMTVWRDGAEIELEFKLATADYNKEYVPSARYDMPPEYLMAGGLVFQPLTEPYLRSWGSEWQRRAPVRLVRLKERRPTEENPGCVLLSLVLPDSYNLGYQDYRYLALDKVNGMKITNLPELKHALDHPKESFHVIEFLPGESVQKMVLDAVQLKSATQRVMFDYRLPTDYFVGSKDSEP